MTSKPTHPQTVMRMIEYRAPSELAKNPIGCAAEPMPIFSNSHGTMPKFGSSAHRKMIAVAIDDTTTGTKTAVR